ncbi:MAG TPA: cache domain-containing protein [Patescibacteria group bacterium]|nr:cache domain-containing protein [Patescibacteria group bacterium]
MVAFLGMCLVFAGALYVLNNEVLDGRKAKVQDLVDSASGILAGYESEARAGHMTVEEAKAGALRDIKGLRYGNNDYFWIHDLNTRMVMHPIKPEMDGTDISSLKDASGQPMFVMMNQVVKAKGAGFYYYDWTKPESSKPVRKLSYVKQFTPWGWVIGTGIYIDDVEAAFWSRALEFGFGVLALTALVLMVSWVVARRITAPLVTLSGVMGALSHNDLSVHVPATHRLDEVGDMGRAVAFFKEGLIRAEALAEQQRQGDWAKDKRARVVDNLLLSFNEEVTEALGGMTASASELESMSRSMSATAAEASTQAAAVAAAVEETAVSMRTAAGSADQLARSGEQVSQRVNDSVRIAENASEAALRATTMVNSLSQAVGKIGDVVGLIADIASQTNLLALNATIEAARAGDAGKGFAVVAGEVKTLANQTSKATDEIGAQIATVQRVTVDAVDAITSVTTVIAEISQISGVIAAAVSEQDAATGEIAANVQQVAQATGEVSANILRVTRAAENTGQAAADVGVTAQGVADRATKLRDRVDTFLTSIRGT